MNAGHEIQVVLCPVDDGRVVVIHRVEDYSRLERLGGLALDTALSKLSGASSDVPKTRARVFTTTPEVERLLAGGRTYAAKLAPGHFLPVVLNDDGHYLRQVPLKEVDPGLVASAANPAVLATAVAVQVVLQRLAVLEDLVREVRADVAELIDREDSRQRAELRAAFMDLADFGGLAHSTDVEWSIVQRHRDTLMTLHGEILEEMQRLGGRLNQHRSLTRNWASLEPKQAERVDVLIKLETLVIEGLERWTALYLLHRPLDGSTEEARRAALRRIEAVRGEAISAISMLPAGSLPDKPELTTVMKIGPIRANLELARARRNYEKATPDIAATLESITIDNQPTPLQILA